MQAENKKDNRIKNNLMSGLLYQVVILAIAFILPRLYLENFGSEVNGVLSTIKQIFTYLCLLEAGAGLATTQALYKPVAENDYSSISGILSATHIHYIKTGILYAFIMTAIGVVYSWGIKTSLNPRVVFLIIILTGLPSLYAYFIQAKYRILMEVDGRKYIITNSETILQIASNFGKILVLLLTDSLVLIQVVYCILVIIQMFYIHMYAKRRYKFINLKEKPNHEAIGQKNSVLVHQLSGMVFNNTDVILLSALTDFKTVSVYAIYNMFFQSVQNFITGIISGISFKMGQLFNTDREKFDKVYAVYENLYVMLAFIIYTLMAVFLLPLIQIYTGGINDADYSNALLMFLFALLNIIANAKLPSNQVLEYSGMFKKTRSHAVVEMIINIMISVIAILKFGICGAIVGTVVALIYRGIVSIDFVNRKVLFRSQFKTYKCFIVNGAVFLSVMLVFFTDSFSKISFIQLLLNGIVHSAWIVALYVGINLVFNVRTFKTLIGLYRERKV